MSPAVVTRPLPVRLGSAEARIRRQMHLGRAPLALSWGTESLSLSVASPREVAAQGAPPVRVGLAIGGASGHLGLPGAVARLVLERLTPGGAAVPPDHPDLDLLLETALAEPLAALEALLGQSVHLTPAGELSPDHLLIGWRVSRAGLPLGVASLRLPPAEARRLGDALDQLPAQPGDLGALRLLVSLEAGSAWLSLGELGGLGRGDIVLSDQTLTESTVVVVLNHSRRLVGELTKTGVRIIGAAAAPSEGSIDMEQSPPTDGATETPSLKDLSVRVVFEAARLELPLAQLEAMRPGYVLDLARPASLMVDLMVRGQCVGKAELVQVDNTLGARIVRLFGHD